jgi:hypothetical protein
VTKICSKCGAEKPLEEFPRRPDRPLGRGSVCLACGRAYRRAHYLANIRYYVEKGHRGRLLQRRRNYERLIAYLRSHPCIDCGESDIRVLQFDHLDPREKVAEVSYLVRRGGTWPRVLREIEKCAVRCGNCHRRKTRRDLLSRMDTNDLAEERCPWFAGR